MANSDDTNHIHIHNKREMFERMHMYHRSELAQKSDMITLFKSFIAGLIVIDISLIAASLQNNLDFSIQHLVIAAYAIALIFNFSTAVICSATTWKIEMDHEQYQISLSEYERESRYLQLTGETVFIHNEPTEIKPLNINQRSGPGYLHTIIILWVAWLAFFAVAYVLTLGTIYLAMAQNEQLKYYARVFFL